MKRELDEYFGWPPYQAVVCRGIVRSRRCSESELNFVNRPAYHTRTHIVLAATVGKTYGSVEETKHIFSAKFGTNFLLPYVCAGK